VVEEEEEKEKKGEFFPFKIRPPKKKKKNSRLTIDPSRSTSGSTPSSPAACSTAASNASIPCGAPNPRNAVLEVAFVLATLPFARSLGTA